MAVGTEAAPDGWLSIFTSLPPQLQGVFVVVVALVVGYLAYRRFIKQLKGESPPSTEFAFGEPTTFADMGPVREVVSRLMELIGQLTKTEAAHLRIADAIDRRLASEERVADGIEQLSSLMTTFLDETRERKEEEDIRAAEERGYARALEDKGRRLINRRRKKPGVTN